MDLDGCSGAGPGLDGNLALMVLDNAVNDGHSETASAAGRFLKRIKNRFETLPVYPQSFIVKRQNNIAMRIVLQPDMQRAAARHSMQRIDRKIPDDLFHLIDVKLV